jgi:hypothetical protein
VTAPHGAGAGPEGWLDMSRYPDTDPDTALTGREQDLLSTSLAVDVSELPDAVWEHMLAVVTGAEAGDGTDTETDPDNETDPETGTDDPGVDTWAIDGETEPGPHDPAEHDAGDPAGHVDDAWAGGAV